MQTANASAIASQRNFIGFRRILTGTVVNQSIRQDGSTACAVLSRLDHCGAPGPGCLCLWALEGLPPHIRQRQADAGHPWRNDDGPERHPGAKRLGARAGSGRRMRALWYTARDREGCLGTRERPRIPACLLALTVNSGMRYRIFFRLFCGCPPDGKLSWIASASRAGICQAVLLTVCHAQACRSSQTKVLGLRLLGKKIAGVHSGACRNEAE